MSVLDVMDTRETASAIWMMVFLLWVFVYPKSRRAAYQVVRAFLAWKVSLVFSIAVIYICLVAVLLHRLDYWRPDLLPETIVWFFSTGFVLLLNIGKTIQSYEHFTKILRSILTLTLLLEFFFNLYTFSLAVELLIVPFLFVLVGVGVVAGTKAEYFKVKKLVDVILTALSVYYIVYILSNVFNNVGSVATSDNLRSFALTPLLSTAFLPMLYLVALVFTYEDFFISLDFRLKSDTELSKYAKHKVLEYCHLDLRKLIQVRKSMFEARIRANNATDVVSFVHELERGKTVKWQFVSRWVLRLIGILIVSGTFLFIAYAVVRGVLDIEIALSLVGLLGGWVVAIVTLVVVSMGLRTFRHRELNVLPYHQITDWVRRADTAAFDCYQKADGIELYWDDATSSWETTKAEFNWVMGLARSLDNPLPLYNYLERHFELLLAYELLAQEKHNKRDNGAKYKDLQLKLHTSSGEIYREVRMRQ